ncbi:hypothetical protein C0J52_03301 [Blattella germanica]|nr:hypothetical protein C0J52_03301 [Blattella germanica]
MDSTAQQIEEEWRKSSLKLLYKGKGDTNNPDSYRGIALESVGLKILTRVIANRVKPFLPEERFVSGQWKLIFEATERELRRGENRHHHIPDRRTISSWVNQWRTNASVVNKKHVGPHETVRTSENRRVLVALQKSPQRSVRHHARTLGMSRTSLRRIVKSDLKFHPYKLEVCQELRPVDRQNRYCLLSTISKRDVQYCTSEPEATAVLHNIAIDTGHENPPNDIALQEFINNRRIDVQQYEDVQMPAVVQGHGIGAYATRDAIINNHFAQIRDMQETLS